MKFTLLQLAVLAVFARARGVAEAELQPGIWMRKPFEMINVEQNAQNTLYTIEGEILYPDRGHKRFRTDWPAETTLSINGGEYKGFVRLDGSFIISGIPSGSYILDIYHPDLKFQSLRVEINSTGKIRARKLSFLRSLPIHKVPYPLYLKPLGFFQYFRKREQWNIIDYVMNPVILITVAPLLLTLLLPRLINDPETKREIEAAQFPKISNVVPDLSDILTTFLAQNRSAAKPIEKKKKITGTAAAKNKNRLAL